LGPGLYLRHQHGAIKLSAIELSAIDRHAPIVKSLVWPNELATQLFAALLAAQPALHNAFIALHGDLGAGKTTLVRHLLQALGVQGRVKSPTYAVVEPYELTQFHPTLNVWHFDFYRFTDPLEWEDAGFRDIFASTGLKIAEWPEKAQAMLPVADIDLHISTCVDASRQVSLVARTPIGAALVRSCTTPGVSG
jgi:tRNA threonylcarbamoyladenosine biosynthesis protein TsaE